MNAVGVACVHKNPSDFFLKQLSLDFISSCYSTQSPKPKVLSAMQLDHSIFKIHDANFDGMQISSFFNLNRFQV